jgi:hypothetical protein
MIPRESSLSGQLLGDSIDVFVRREDAERVIADVRGDDLELATFRLRLARRQMRGGAPDTFPLSGALRAHALPVRRA